MNLIEFKTEIVNHTDYKDLSFSQWDGKIKYRGLHVKFDDALSSLVPMYIRKITDLRERLSGDWDFSINISLDGKKLKSDAEIFDAVSQSMDEWYYCQNKEQRLSDKLACVLEEQELRKNGLVSRTPHHTDYYIDYVNGDDARTGLNPDTTGDGSWKTITKYTTTTVRSAGDIAYLRANITWNQGAEAVDIIFDEDGTVNDFIYIIGCDASVNDPWTDSSDVKPIIDFQDAAYQVNLNGDNFWRFERLDFRQTADTSGLFYNYVSRNTYYKDCVFRDGNASGVEGLYFTRSSWIVIDNCSFENTFGWSIYTSRSIIEVKNTTFTAGADVGSSTGIRADAASHIVLKDVTFSGSFSGNDVDVVMHSILYARNVNWSGSGIYKDNEGIIFSEDDNAVYGAHKAFLHHGEITKDTGVTRGGGASSSAKMEPDSNTGANRALILSGRLGMTDFKIWCPASATTITIYIRSLGVWSAYPTNTQLYIEASYLSAAPTRSTVVSNDVLSDETTWVAFDVAFTPNAAGWVYITVNLKKYESAKGCYVDIKPVIS